VKKMKTGIHTVYLLLFLMGGCVYIKPDPPPPQMSEVERLRSIFPVYPGFVQTPNDFRVASPNVVSLSLSFKSEAPFDDVRHFYVEKLTPEGWQLVKERQLSEWGRDVGGRSLEFRRGEYHIAIEKGGRNNDDWDYGINFSWNKR
jgi:hypothetical protein